MKSNLLIKRHELPYHVERPFYKALTHTAKEHGFVGMLAKPDFIWHRLKDHILQVLARIVPFSGIRVGLQRMRGVRIGHYVHLGPLVTIDDVYPYFVSIGAGTSIAGQNFILTHNKPLEYHSEVSEAYVAPVEIGKHVWIAVNVTILPGVAIGEGSIIASGSVVTRSIPPFVMAAGIPAKVVKDISPKLRKNYNSAAYEKILEKRLAEFGF